MQYYCLCLGTSYYALWKDRQQRLQAAVTKYVVSRSTHRKQVPDTAHASTAAISGHVVTETETDFSRQEPEPQMVSTDDDDVWSSATTSPTALFPVTSLTEDGNPMTLSATTTSPGVKLTGNIEPAAGELVVTSFTDCKSTESNSWKPECDVCATAEIQLPLLTENGDPVTSFSALERSGLTANNERAAGESPVTSFVDNGDPVTPVDNLIFPETNDASTLTKSNNYADMECRVTSLTWVGNNDGYFLDTQLTRSNECAAQEFILTSSTNDGNPVTSYSTTVSSPPSEKLEVSAASRSTGSCYPKTGSDVKKLVLTARNEDGPMILHRIQIPTVGEVLAEVGVVEQSSTESAGSAATTSDYSMALLHDSMLDVSSSRDVVNYRDSDENDQTAGACRDTTQNQSVIVSEPANRATTSRQEDFRTETGDEQLYFDTQLIFRPMSLESIEQWRHESGSTGKSPPPPGA